MVEPAGKGSNGMLVIKFAKSRRGVIVIRYCQEPIQK